MVSGRTRLLGTTLLALAFSARAAPPPVDPLEPVSDPATALVSPLRLVTVATGSPAATWRFYVDGAAMTPSRAVTARPSLPRFWHSSVAGPIAVFTRPGVDGAVAVRSVTVNANLDALRPGWDANVAGGLAMGMPVAGGDAAREAVMLAAGFRSAVGVTTMTLPRADGSTYPVQEVHFRAPDGVLVLGIDRGGMTPVGPIDPATKIGGPAYSSLVVADADKSAPFFRDVLGYELRREFTYTSAGSKGGLGLPDGTRVRFQQWYAPGSRTGYVIVLDLLNAGREIAAAPPFARRGIAMWSFETADLARVAARVAAAGAPLLSPVSRVDLPGIGRVTALLTATPDGFPIEIYQRSGK